jgi:peptidoglycan/xylan/chitin deacetylase (PgdA/CDA1 family)
MTSLLIVCFHRVLMDTNVDTHWPWLVRGSAMFSSDLRCTLDLLGQRYTWANEDDVVRLLQDPTQQKKSPMCWITFDDGYQDNLRVAAPLLSSYRIEPTLFLTTGVLEPGFRLPVDRWYSTILNARREEGAIDLGFGSFYWDPTALSTRQRMVAGPEKAAFIQADPAGQDAWIERLEEVLGCREDVLTSCPHAYLQSEDLQTLESMGWRIGPHGLSHRILNGVPPDVLRRELCLPAQTLQNLGLLSSRFFAWPDGQADPQALDAAAAYLAPLGILGGLSIEAREVHAADCRLFMPRVLVQNHADSKLHALISSLGA